MRVHSRVLNFRSVGAGLYEIGLVSGSTLRVFVCECYSYGVAEYFESKRNLGWLDVIVINSVWCGYTSEVKLICRGERVGLFRIGDFMAALSKPELWSYLNEQDVKSFKENGWE
jgi:hypothetical protein